MFVVTRRTARVRTRWSGSDRPAINAPFAPRWPESASAVTPATATYAPNECTWVSALIVIACSRRKPTYARFGPRRSATTPSGVLAISPITPAIVRPMPTWATDNPATRVRYIAPIAAYTPLPRVLTSVAMMRRRTAGEKEAVTPSLNRTRAGSASELTDPSSPSGDQAGLNRCSIESMMPSTCR